MFTLSNRLIAKRMTIGYIKMANYNMLLAKILFWYLYFLGNPKEYWFYVILKSFILR